MDTCPYCGQPWRAEIVEAWTTHEFLLDSCCESGLALAVDDLHSSARHRQHRRGLDRRPVPGWAAKSLAEVGAQGVAADESGLWLDHRIRVEPCTFSVARSFVLGHHRHCGPPVGHLFSGAIHNGPTRIGVVMVGRPVARMIDYRSTCEINRLCINPHLPGALTRNAASQLLAWACREAALRGYSRVITYTRAEETGASLVASGFHRETMTRPDRWGRPSRPRQTPATGPKWRWARTLSPAHAQNP